MTWIQIKNLNTLKLLLFTVNTNDLIVSHIIYDLIQIRNLPCIGYTPLIKKNYYIKKDIFNTI